jgi:two-component system chemotaxis sensor kinase CheA
MSLANEEVDELRAAVAACAPYPELAEMLARLKLEPLSVMLGRLARQGSALAKQLGKDVDVVVESSTLRVDGAALAPIFSALVHAMRNAVDHGVDRPDDRVARVKPPRARIVLRATMERRGLLLEVSDDGAGVDWEAVRAKALARGLPHDTPADLLAAILSDNFSTRSEATEISGRGLGLAALRATAEALGGSTTILSRPKHGSRLQVWLPSSVVWPEPKRVAA